MPHRIRHRVSVATWFLSTSTLELGARSEPSLWRSSIDRCLRGSAVAFTMNRNARRGLVDRAEVSLCEHHVRRTEVLLEAVDLGGAGDGHHPRLAREDPGQRDLRGGRLLLRRNALHEVDD